MAGQPHSRGALSRELSGIPVTKTHQLASYVSEMQTPSLCRAGTGTEVIEYCIPQLPRSLDPGSLFLLAECHRENPLAPSIMPEGASKAPPSLAQCQGASEFPPLQCMACCHRASESLCPWHRARWIRTWHTVLASGSVPGLISSINHCCVLQDVGPGTDLALL